MTESFPLSWPAYRERTSSYQRRSAPFKATPGKARDFLFSELKRLGASAIVVSCNIATYRRAGVDIPYADQSAASTDPGVAVYYVWRGEQYCLSCDKWNKVVDNMQSIAKTIEAIRGIERWGSGEMLKAAFSGFKSLPEPEIKKSAWYDILKVSKNASPDEIKRAYREQAFKRHPDHGGTKEAFAELHRAYTEALS